MPDGFDVHTPSPDDGHEIIRLAVVKAIEDLGGVGNDLGDSWSMFDVLLGMAGDSMAALTTVQGQLAAMKQRVDLGAAVTSLPLLAIGSTDVTLSWGKNLGDASYQVELIPAPSLLGNVTLTVKTTYATSCIVTVKATSLVAAGGSLTAIPYRYA